MSASAAMGGATFRTAAPPDGAWQDARCGSRFTIIEVMMKYGQSLIFIRKSAP